VICQTGTGGAISLQKARQERTKKGRTRRQVKTIRLGSTPNRFT
jgi:hypothetical protein